MSAPEAVPGDRLATVTLHEERPPARTPDQQQEIDVALYDLAEENRFRLVARAGGPPPPGPYALTIAIHDRRLVFDLRAGGGEAAAQFHLSLTPLRDVLADYGAICAQYVEAVRALPPARIEAIDMGRRGLHDEGSKLLLERLEGKADTDLATARRLFTLIAALMHRG